MMIATKLKNTLEHNTWVNYPGVISGCRVSTVDNRNINISEGKLCFANGYTAAIANVKNACFVPDTHTKIMYVVAIVNEKTVTFRCVDDPARSNGINMAAPVSLLNGIVLAQLEIDNKGNISIYNYVPQLDNTQVRTTKLFPVPDGIRSKFYIPSNIYSEYSLKVSVNGIGQVEHSDYTIGKEKNIDGSYTSFINFIGEVPVAGSDIIVTIYTGRSEVHR